MQDVSRFCARMYRPLSIALLASTVLVAWSGRHKNNPSAIPLDDWDIPRLAAYLSDRGMTLRMVPTQKDGPIDRTAFLTTTDKEWDDLNHLIKDLKRMHQWQGTLYCMRDPGGAELICQGNCSMIIGPFLFYGDPDLQARVRAALAPLVLGEPAA